MLNRYSATLGRLNTTHTFIIAGIASLVCLGAFLHLREVNVRPWAATPSSVPHGAEVSSNRHCPAHCPSDPFTQPGMLHWSTEGNANETRWMPFAQSFQEWEVQPGSYDLPKVDVVPEEAWAVAAPQWTARLQNGEDAEWLRGRTILFVDDRNNVEQLCGVLGGDRKSWGDHEGGFCRVKRLDLVIMNWFLWGMIDNNERWPYEKPKPKIFEERIPKMRKLMQEDGLQDRKIHLAVVSSLFWDAKFFNQEKLDKDRGETHGFFFNEIAWHRGRMRKLIQYMRQLYGDDLPLMLRSRQLRERREDWALLKIFQLDQGCRAVAKELGVKLFTWGDILEGYDVYYDNDQHFGLGPNTYLFGDMTFFYLHRAVTPGCWGCHQWDDVSGRDIALPT